MAHYGSLEKLGLAFLVGLLFYIVKCFVNVVYTYVIGPAVNKVDFKSKGKWALVTGSTDGIGKQYARELAARGCDIILVSRSIDKLKATASEIENDYKVNTKIIQADFSEEGIYDKISKEITDLEIGTLVNNVGISYSYPEYFTEIPDWERSISTMIKANMVSVTRMTGIVLPDMVKRGKGVVINIGSGSSVIPSPLLTVYAASKAYVDKFSEGLEMEYSKKGIIVQCVLPGFVCSNMSGIRRSTWLAPTAKTFVKSSISLVGTTSKTTGYFPHAVFVNAINLIYAAYARFAVWLVTRSMENTRRKALKKREKNIA
ncbi:very-long-chain 3-oxoacyl-CoA reductase-like [Zerene cesonia]|uniref:very-long-chain 3-oxoacyl-CoA reductase-like n=1 Tax=Zerene cesonia TaxID=33412 RepID=UPI0018E4F9F6|nr:very-long-chain 3-oxoacyl-CoA reductase-like [Zerene cesonia]